MLYDDVIREQDRAQQRLAWYMVGFLAVLVALTCLLGFVAAETAEHREPIENVPAIRIDPLGFAPAPIVSVSVRIRQQQPGGTFAGSGTVVATNGAVAPIVTCRHVCPAQYPSPLYVDFPSGYTTTATWLGADKTADLAVIYVATPYQFSVPAVGTQIPAKGSYVYQVGYPRAKGPHEEKGTVIGVRGTIKTGAQSVAYQMHSDHGDSGSGIFDWETSQLVGVLWGGDGKTTEAMGAPDVRRVVSQYQSYLPPGWGQAGCPGGQCPTGGGIGSPVITGPTYNPAPVPAAPVAQAPVAQPVTGPSTLYTPTNLGAAIGGVGLPVTLLGFWINGLRKKALAAAASPQGQQLLGQQAQLLAGLLPVLIQGMAANNNGATASQIGTVTAVPNQQAQTAQLLAQLLAALSVPPNQSLTSGS